MRPSGWRFDHLPRPDTAQIWGFASSPAVIDGVVVVGGLDGRVYGFGLAGGNAAGRSGGGG